MYIPLNLTALLGAARLGETSLENQLQLSVHLISAPPELFDLPFLKTFSDVIDLNALQNQGILAAQFSLVGKLINGSSPSAASYTLRALATFLAMAAHDARTPLSQQPKQMSSRLLNMKVSPLLFNFTYPSRCGL
jgi:hypothetical protein